MNVASTENIPKVTVIPATIDRQTRQPLTSTRKRRTAAYARVSTDLTEQLNSYRAQVDFYTNHIQSNPDWEFVSVYTDEGISATSTAKRGGFNRMVKDALAGKIDFIITKSVSRFARNTVDSLQTVRALKEKGVEVYFEKENIYTLDSKGELLITIMSSLAQEESRSISENVTWGQRKRMQDGKVSMPYKHFLGYEKDPDGKPRIVESEAETVRRIYDLFLAGKAYREISALLTAEGVPTPSGRTNWSVSTTKSILSNEKYAGNAILQKKYTVDFLTKKQKVNEGEVPQYFVENSHPAIISPSTFELVQVEIRRREQLGKNVRSKLFASKVVCGECGEFYGPKVWHSGTKYHRVVWRCNGRYRQRGVKGCSTPHFSEEALKSAFVVAWAALLGDKERYIAQYEKELKSLGDNADFDKQTAVLTAECAEAAALIEDCVAANAANALNQEEYIARYEELVARYDEAKTQLDTLNQEKQERRSRREKISRLLAVLRRTKAAPGEFDEGLFRETAEVITVHSLEKVVVRFFSGSEVQVNMRENK